MIKIKNILFAFSFFWTTAALGQVAGFLSNEPQVLEFPSHPKHAARRPMGQEQNLLGDAGYAYTYAQGERPLWDVAPVSNPVPLGDVARMLRKEHETAKKADVVWTN